MSILPRTPASIQKDRALALLGIACMGYPTWFCVMDLLNRTFRITNPGTLIDLAIVAGGLATLVYFVGIWASLKHPEYNPKKYELLDQMDELEWRVLRMPWGIKIPGFLALLVSTGLAAFIAFISAKRFGLQGNALNTDNEIKVLLMLPTAAIAAVTIFRTLFKTRVAIGSNS